MSDSICFMSAFTQSSAEVYFLNKSLVTILTRTSVHCAERIVAINISRGFTYLRAIFALGYVFLNIGKIFRTLSAASALSTLRLRSGHVFIFVFFAAVFWGIVTISLSRFNLLVMLGYVIPLTFLDSCFRRNDNSHIRV